MSQSPNKFSSNNRGRRDGHIPFIPEPVKSRKRFGQDLQPIEVVAHRYADVEPDPGLVHQAYPPEPEDYVITNRLPLASRLRLQQECTEPKDENGAFLFPGGGRCHTFQIQYLRPWHP